MADSHRNLHTPVELAEYLYTRLSQLGMTTVHGSILQCDSNNLLEGAGKANLSYVNSFNEAHAAFAADGYARIKGISALISTHGPHETTANQILLRAHAENVSIVHIVSYPTVGQGQDREVLRWLLRQGHIGSIDQASAYTSVVVLAIA